MKIMTSRRFSVLLSIALVVVFFIELDYLINGFKQKETIQNSKISNSHNYSNTSSLLPSSTFMNSLDKSMIVSRVIVSEFKGTISKVITEPGIMYRIKYEKGLVLKGDNNGSYEFLYRKKDLLSVKIFEGSIEGIEIRFDDLKEGDKLKIKYTFDLGGNNPYSLREATILRL